ncbi:MAG: class I SAM-dependent methyltransferase [Anaerolineae bacterium]
MSRKEWSDKTVLACWDRTAPKYGQAGPPIFSISAQRLLELMSLKPGDRLLDVACGRGAVAIPAAKQVGPSGHVTATDYSPCMVAEAEKEANKRGLSNITCACMEAQNLEFPDNSFDALTCSFALFFFPDMRRALAEMRRVLVPGGKLGLSLWGKGAIVPPWPILGETIREYGLRPVVPNPIAWRPEAIEALLTSAGFSDIEIVEERYDLPFREASEVWEFTLSVGPIEVMLERLSKNERQEFIEAFLSRIRELATPEGIPANFRVLYALAKGGTDR